MLPLFLIYLLAVNVMTFLLFGLDKHKAKRGKWRISEATLLTMAVIGGSIGAWGGMRIWHPLYPHSSTCCRGLSAHFQPSFVFRGVLKIRLKT